MLENISYSFFSIGVSKKFVYSFTLSSFIVVHVTHDIQKISLNEWKKDSRCGLAEYRWSHVKKLLHHFFNGHCDAIIADHTFLLSKLVKTNTSPS